MTKQSAGILMYRRSGRDIEVLLVHPGGPFWARKDEGAWSIPKGLRGQNEDPLIAAKREFEEETGCAPQGEFLELGNFRQPGGKTIVVWGVEGDFDLANFRSNLFTLEWPPKSGRFQEFPEADRGAWFTANEALSKILKGQAPFIAKLLDRLE